MGKGGRYIQKVEEVNIDNYDTEGERYDDDAEILSSDDEKED